MAGLTMPLSALFSGILLTAFAVAAITADLRWLLIALMLLMLVIPTAIAVIYLWKILTPESALAVLPRYAVIDPGVSITVTHRSDENRPSPPADIRIIWSDISGCTIYRKGLLFRTKGFPRWIFIPEEAVRDGTEIYKIIELCSPDIVGIDKNQ